MFGQRVLDRSPIYPSKLTLILQKTISDGLSVGSYGVVFKAIRNEKKIRGIPLSGNGDTAATHNENFHGD